MFLLYGSAIFLSSFLLFQVQPMIAKMILPWFGGSASVWITAMLFFQTGLLGGYLYAHWSINALKPKLQAVVHISLLAASLLFLPVAPAIVWKPDGTEEPVIRILLLLAASVGLPYLLLSSTSPLLQAWYARSREKSIPYRFFALSNLASLMGLLAYPLAVEPMATLRQQSIGWSALYILFVLSAGVPTVLAYRTIKEKGIIPATSDDSRPPRMGVLILWLLLACCASTLLLSVTNHLTQNITSVPFLWVLPLGVYLLTFILTFDFEWIYNRKLFGWLVAAVLGAMCYGLVKWNSRTDIRPVISMYLAGLFICCMFCHGELVRRKPVPRYLTSFYLMISLGGALGGLVVGLAAPKLLPAFFELPLTLCAVAVLLVLLLDYRKWRFTIAVAWAVAVAVMMIASWYISAYGRSAVVMARNFYGGLRVIESGTGTGRLRSLIHGTVIHGKQFMTLDREFVHITYYSDNSGIGLALRSLRRPRLRVGVIGLGAGSLAAFAETGDVFRFYEINPLVERIAREDFTYLNGCLGKVEIVRGDGRLSLERENPQNYDLLAVDAFSGDSVPVHLLTKQAFQLYFRHLRPGGILALNVTNSHIDLAPVIEAIRRELGKSAVLITNTPDKQKEIYPASWVLLSASPLKNPEITKYGTPLPFWPGIRPWTDDYSNLLQILK